MTKNISLTEYNQLIEDLDFISPFDKCCEDGDMKVVIVEPLYGRNTLEVDRSCVVQCSKCEKRYLSRWD